MTLNKIILFVMIMLACSCSDSAIKGKLDGAWIVEEFVVDGENRMWEELKVNAIVFYSNGVCGLPVRDSGFNDKGKWQIDRRDSSYYLIISESQDSIFNGAYRIGVDYRRQGDATVKVLTLESEGLAIKCSQ